MFDNLLSSNMLLPIIFIGGVLLVAGGLLRGAMKNRRAREASAPDPAQSQKMEQMLVQMSEFYKEMRTRGESAPARILTVGEMGMRVNGVDPLITTQLEVQPANRPAFQAFAQGVVAAGSMSKYQPGATVWVKFDPNDPSKVILDHS